jgi:hypothetical protein
VRYTTIIADYSWPEVEAFFDAILLFQGGTDGFYWRRDGDRFAIIEERELDGAHEYTDAEIAELHTLGEDEYIERQNAEDDPLTLIRTVYDAMYAGTNSFELSQIGADMAYLFGAISKNECCEWPAGQPFLRILRKKLPPPCAVWQFIKIDEHSEICLLCNQVPCVCTCLDCGLPLSDCSCDLEPDMEDQIDGDES